VNLVKITNTGAVPFVGKWSGQRFEIRPGETKLVPEDAAWHWTGRHWLVGNRRREELDRLKLLYGAHYSLDDLTAEELWERNKPSLEVWTLDGDKVTTVIDDPEGRTVTPSSESEAERDLLRSEIDALRKRLEALQGEYAARQRGEATSVEEIPEDRPTKVRVRG
jgi:hypothetical protein